MLKSRFSLEAAIIITVAALLACTSGEKVSPPVSEQGPKDYGTTQGLFNERWWNYYERGLSYAEGELWSEAARDFESAIGLREEDAWRARTYGMHFIDYFPNRELGIVCLQQGEAARAEILLKQSMEQAPSSRASHFLNEARRVLLKSEAEDRQGPAITASLDHPSPTSRRSMVLEARISDPAGVSAVHVAGQEEFIELAQPEYAFRRELALKPGKNKIVLSASDLAGNNTTEIWSVLCDPVGPTVAVDRDARPPRFRIQDNEAVVRVEWGNAVLWEGNQREVAVELPGDGKSLREIKAIDGAGNATVFAYQEAQAGRMQSRSRVAGSWLAATGGPMRIAIVNPPVRTPLDHVALTLRADSHARMKEVTVNGIPVEPLPPESSWCVSHLVDLATRTNTIEVRALNEEGIEAVDRCVIRRDYDLLDDNRTKLRMDVLPLEGEKPEEAEKKAWILFERRLAGLDRFRFIDRSLLPYSLQELILQETGIARKSVDAEMLMISPECVTRLAFAEQFQSGWSDWNGTEIEARVNNVWTGEVVSVDDVYVPARYENRLDYYMKGLALKVAQRFPRLEGKIREVVPGKGFVIDMETIDGLRPNMKSVAIHEDPAGFDDPIIVECLISKVKKEEVKLKIQNPKGAEAIVPGDGTLTK